MGVYFCDQDNKFAPEGAFTLEGAIIYCANKWYGVDLKGLIDWSSRDWSNRGDLPDIEKLEDIFKKCWNRLRSYFASQQCNVYTLDHRGDEGSIPQKFWLSEAANEVTQHGKVPYLNGFTDEYHGRILINEFLVYEIVGRYPLAENRQNYSRLSIVNYGNSGKEDEYTNDGYVSISNAFDIVFTIRKEKARADGVLSGSPATIKARSDIIADEVSNHIMSCLESGKIYAYHFDVLGDARRIRKHDWREEDEYNRGGYIREQVLAVENLYTDNHRWINKVDIIINGQKMPGDVVFVSDDIAILLSDEEVAVLEMEEEIAENEEGNVDYNSDRPRRGAKAKYDKDLFMWEALKFIYYDTGFVPKDYSEHALEAMARYEKAGGVGNFPKHKDGKHKGEYKDNRWARNEISKLWDKMGFVAGYKLPEN